MSVSLSTIFNGYQSFLANGLPNDGGFIYTYLAGTTTPAPTYTGVLGFFANANPIPLSAGGTPPNQIWLTDGVAYKMVVVDNNLVPVPNGSFDNIVGSGGGLVGYISQLVSSTGASLIGAIQSGVGAVSMTVLDWLRERVTARQFGAKFDNSTDDGPAFNRAILKLSIDGGGTLHAGRGTAKIITSILHASNVNLDLSGCTLSGTGSNTIIKSGAVISGVLTDITTEYGTGAQGAGTNLVLNARIIGGKLMNAAVGIRGHRFNYGTTIEHVNFDATLTNAWITSHSWGLKVHQNLVYSPSIMKDFVDWTEISGNSFEGAVSTNALAALTITTGGYGGSYSARIVSNGFHHWTKGVEFTCEATNTVIESNHFEDTKYHLVGSAQTCKNFRISNNWMKANLIPSGSGVIGVSFISLWDSQVGPNTFTTDGVSTFDAYVNLTPSNCFGNTVLLPYSPPGTVDISNYQLNDASNFVMRGGSNDPAKGQPTVESFTGSGYSVVQYKNRYHDVLNTIPYCTTVYNSGTITIDTWIPCTQYGVNKKVVFDFFINGVNSYMVTGMIGLLIVKTEINHDYILGTPSTLTVVASNNSGILRITISGANTTGNITGWVKQA